MIDRQESHWWARRFGTKQRENDSDRRGGEGITAYSSERVHRGKIALVALVVIVNSEQ